MRRASFEREPRLACAVLVAFAAAVMVADPGPAGAQGAQPLTSDERARALQVEGTGRTSAAASPGGSGRLATAPTAAAAKSYVTGVVPLEPLNRASAGQGRSAAAPTAPRRAQVTRFDYASGATVRTIVDLNSGTVLDTQSEVNAATPLAPEELAEAEQLFLAAVPAAAGAVRSGSVSASAPRAISHLVVTAPAPSAPRYGHRVVLIWSDRPRTSKYLVDLTTREVVKSK